MGVAAVTTDELRSLARQMADNPRDAVALASALADTARSLPPDRADVLSPIQFEPATLFTLGAVFENVPLDSEPPPYVIELTRDSWVRSVSAIAYLSAQETQGDLADLAGALQLIRAASASYGQNLRGLFETNWRIDSMQGFISRGAAGEVLAPAPIVTSDGFHWATMDWRLQTEQTIEVRIRSRRDRLQLPEGVTAPDTLRYVVVTFWVEELGSAPSVQTHR